MGGKLNRRKWVAVKLEVTKGTPISLAAADAKILAFDPTIDQETQFAERMPSGMTMGELENVPEEYAGRAKIRIELKGSGTDGTPPLWASTLLAACGMVETDGLFNLVSDLDDQQTVTIAIWEDGLKKSIYGAMGTFTIEADYAKRVFIEFDMRGIYSSVIDQAQPSDITQETTKPLRFAGAAFTLASYHPMISQFRMESGNEVQLRPDVELDGASRPSGLVHAYISDRKAKMSLDPESVAVADYDLFGLWIATTTQALSLQVGTVAGNTCVILAPKTQYIDPKSANRNGLATHQTGCKLIVTDGDDEFSIDFNIPS